MDKKEKLKITKTVASAMCVGMLAVGSFGATDNVVNARDINVAQSNIIATQTASETPEYAVEVWNGEVRTQGYSTLAEAITNAATGSTIKIYTDFIADQTFTITGKTLTIDGQNHTINNATWLKNVFTVSDDATLTINNLIIDGGATTWEIDYENAVPDANYALVPLKNFESEARHTQPVIKSTGNLIANNLKVQNIYTPNGNTRAGGQNGAGINVTKGTLSLTNCTFKHIAGQVGGAVYAVSTMNTTKTGYDITNVTIDNCLFENNHSSGRGGALNITYVEETVITNTNFISNGATRNNGGALMIDAGVTSWTDDNGTPEDDSDDKSISGTWDERLGLDYPTAYIENCLFRGNWCGNDGFAIENEGAEMTIKNSQFIENVGPNTTRGCVGTVSYQVKQYGWVPQYVEGCLFEGNIGATSGIGDHASNVEVVVKDTEFKNNSGVTTVLIYNAQVELEGVSFENEKVTNSVIDARSYNDAENYSDKYEGPSLTVKDSTITGTEGGTDVMVRAYDGDDSKVPFKVTFEGETQAEVELKNNGQVVINSETHEGNVTLDATATEAEVVIAETANLVGEVQKIATYTLTLIHPKTGGGEYQDVVYVEEGATLDAKVLQTLVNAPDQTGKVLNWYTSSSYTTLWDYNLNKNYTLYGRWDEHEHDETAIVVRPGGIYKACSCGHETEEFIAVVAPTSLNYDGTAKGVTVNNTIGALDTEYTVTYYVKQGTAWTKSTETPKNAGEYKAVLTYNGYTAELYYTVAKLNYDLSKLKFENATFEYDGKAHELVVSGVPEGVTVTYENNGQTKAGNYIVTVHFKGNRNYNAIEDMSAVLTIVEKDNKLVTVGIGAGAGAVVGGGLVGLLSLIFKKKKGDGSSKSNKKTSF